MLICVPGISLPSSESAESFYGDRMIVQADEKQKYSQGSALCIVLMLLDQVEV